jgi:adenylate cyclase
MRRLLASPMGIALLMGLALSVLRFAGCAPLLTLDVRSVDLRLLARGPLPPAEGVVIVAVDNASIAEVGRWPWPRSTMARLVDAIAAAEPAVIGFDIVQSEATVAPDLTSLEGRVDAQALAQLRAVLDGESPEDRALAEAVKRAGPVVLGYFFDFSPREGDTAPDVPVSAYGAVQATGGEGGLRYVPKARSIVSNLPALVEAAPATGYFNTLPDQGDGLFRRVPMVLRYGERFAMPLSLAMLALANPDRPTRLRVAPFGVEEIRFGSQDIPVAEDGQLLLNYRGPGRTFPHVAAADLLAGRADPEALRGRLVVVGVTATAVADVRATPFDGVFPGVEMHATALDNILRGDFLRQPRWVVLVEIAAMLIGVLLLALALRRARGVRAGLFALGLLAAWLAGTQWLFLTTGIPLGIVHSVLAIVLVYGVLSVQHYVVEEREKRRTREAFSRYLNPELARLVSENPELLRLGGTRECLTVLFSDIRGFTTMSEGMEPETLVEVLNTYLGEMTRIVFARDGTLDKYIGDAIMAVWGAPVPQKDHAARACQAGLDMVARLAACRDDWESRGWPRLDAGIGLHTGDMVVGNMGSAEHLSYTVIGDNVNLASRLEGLTKTYGVQLLVSQATLEAAGDGFVTRELDLVAVKGKALPVRIHELLGRTDDDSPATVNRREVARRFTEGLVLYRERHWEAAAARFSGLLERWPGDGPSQLYLKRCRQFAASPPPSEWDGVTVMESK